MKTLFFLIFMASIIGGTQALAEPATIVIFRHAEKVNDDDIHLSDQGRGRALALADYFSLKSFARRYGSPVALYAAFADEGQSRRSIETLEPAAASLNLVINTDYEKGEEKRLMKEILQNPGYDGRTVIICWSHKDIPNFLKPFRSTLDVPAKWQKGAYDRLWILDHDENGGWRFNDLPQGLLPDDSKE